MFKTVKTTIYVCAEILYFVYFSLHAAEFFLRS